jgi:hypothetical protein
MGALQYVSIKLEVKKTNLLANFISTFTLVRTSEGCLDGPVHQSLLYERKQANPSCLFNL